MFPASFRLGAEHDFLAEQMFVVPIMNKFKESIFMSGIARIILVLTLLAAPMTHAATFWTGPNITYQQFNPDPTDIIIPGAVGFDRNSNGPLYNSEAGETAPNGSTSPIDTLWAFGTLANATNLSYVTFASLRNGDLGAVILNKPMVVRLLNENIYISIMFTDWPSNHMGGFTYVRSTAPAPTVSITSPTNGASFSAPANVSITTSVGGGTVTNVTFRAGANVLGIVTNAPFSLTASNLAAGSYALTAVATAGGLSTTSAVVNITIVSPISTILSPPVVTNGLFAFDYTANPGLTYVVQSSSNLASWVSVVTNVAAGNPAHFSATLVSNGGRYYRVGRVPNP
jgi:hypothetical protein